MSFNNPVNVLLLTPAVPVSWRGPRQYAVSLQRLAYAHEHRMTTWHSWHGPTWSLQLVTAGQLATQKKTHTRLIDSFSRTTYVSWNQRI